MQNRKLTKKYLHKRIQRMMMIRSLELAIEELAMTMQQRIPNQWSMEQLVIELAIVGLAMTMEQRIPNQWSMEQLAIVGLAMTIEQRIPNQWSMEQLVIELAIVGLAMTMEQRIPNQRSMAMMEQPMERRIPMGLTMIFQYLINAFYIHSLVFMNAFLFYIVLSYPQTPSFLLYVCGCEIDASKEFEKAVITVLFFN
ncbi:hypothetical protein BpHYR1_039503 [Brachionus plicatilis]|uniref:Uncharacterized protein n=1 Tax=Brachionus plicatilis TaxID=10195 RepID=A0A3M7Q6R7_BRAPC|nr:hypothetical protein BpHYR1_039503 [Brachionus plicatilis]